LLQSSKNKDQELREALEITNRGMVRLNNTMQPIIQLDMLPGSDETDETIIKQFNWEVVDFKQEYMDFQLTYD
jgi:predicted RNA-binding protein with PUA domain